MKKIIVTLLILFTGPAFAAEFYEAPTDVPEQFLGDREVTFKSATTPVFKRTRLRLKNYLRSRDIKNAQQQQQQQAQESVEAVEGAQIPVAETVQLAVAHEITQSNMKLDADTIEYDDQTGEIYAIGSPVINFVEQGVVLKADVMTYNTNSNILKAYDNVQMIKDGAVMHSDFMQVNTNEETSLVDNMNLVQGNMSVTARNALSHGDKITLNKGVMHTTMTGVTKIQTVFFNRLPERVDFEDDLVELPDAFGSSKYRVKVKDIEIDAKKNHNVMNLKEIEVYSGEKRLFRFPRMRLVAGKDNEYFEGDYPEFGSRRNLGAFFGPGFVFTTPNGAAMKVIPMIVHGGGNLGVGGALKYRGPNNYTEFAYGTSQSRMILRGKQRLDDNFYLQYGSNSYMDDWFMGRNMAKYMAELVYEDGKVIENSFRDGLNLNFKYRGSLGAMQDGDINRRYEDIETTKSKTVRFRQMAELYQELFEYRNSDKQFFVQGGLVMQGSAAIYGMRGYNGDHGAQFIGRVGPRLRTQYKRWLQEVTYYQSAYYDNTPMPLYDLYRYGRSTVSLQELLWLHDKLLVGWRGSINLSNDVVSRQPIMECRFYVAMGPEQMRFSLGYDLIREQTYFDVSMALNTKDSGIEFDKMEIKNADRLSSKESEQITVWEENVPMVKSKMKYAEVLDIEDPDKERIGG